MGANANISIFDNLHVAMCVLLVWFDVKPTAPGPTGGACGAGQHGICSNMLGALSFGFLFEYVTIIRHCCFCLRGYALRQSTLTHHHHHTIVAICKVQRRDFDGNP